MDDPTPVPPGTLGVVESIDDIGNIHCNFLNYNGSLAIVPCKDEFIVIPKNEVFQRVHEVLTKQINYKAYSTPARMGKSANDAIKQAILNEQRRLSNCWDGYFDRSSEASYKRVVEDFEKIIKKQGGYYE